MSLLRWVGLIFGIVILLLSFHKFRGRRIRKGDFLLGFFLSISLIVAAIDPDAVNALRDLLLLSEAQFARLIALLIVSSFMLWVYLFSTRIRLASYEAQFDTLVRSQGVAEFARSYPDNKKLPPITVVIPAYNEAEAIGAVLKRMPDTVCDRAVCVLVIDDGSNDETMANARTGGALAVRSPMNRGGGAALRMGFDIAIRYGADVIVTMDADGQHLPEEMEGLVRPILENRYDIVIGSRLLGSRDADSIVRYVGIHVFNMLIRLLAGVGISDCSNGYRAFRASSLSGLTLHQDQFHTSELLIEAGRKNLRLGEAPVTVKRRLTGESKKGRNFAYGLGFAKTVFKTWWR